MKIFLSFLFVFGIVLESFSQIALSTSRNIEDVQKKYQDPLQVLADQIAISKDEIENLEEAKQIRRSFR
jgi:cell division protein FtsB